MPEIIAAINEFENRKFENSAIEGLDGSDYDYNAESGFDIITTHQTITLAISAFQSCCESWGYFLTEDDPSQFIGAKLRGVSITDTNRSTRKFTSGGWGGGEVGEDGIFLDVGEAMFVDIETDRGILQFVAYNAHNGYYGHGARVSSKQIMHSVTL